MKTLNDFKNEIAREPYYNYDNWKEMEQSLFNSKEGFLLIKRLEIAAERYAKYISIEFQEWLAKGNDYLHDNIVQHTHSSKELFEIFKSEINK